jgi:hypothetical protein|tara:strand:- start:291 stop:1367 length:1077 start_codon:yes stop_codon:yes gene_type:complete
MKHVQLFEGFVASQKLNEAFSSQILRDLFNGGGVHSTLPKAFYGKTKLELDKIQDDDLIVTTPQAAYKAKGKNTITFYISDVEKVNPYAPEEAQSIRSRTIPGGEYMLCVADENNKFFVDRDLHGYLDRVQQMSGKYKTPRSIETDKKRGEETIGINKTRSGWQGTGLTSVKRIAEVSDRAIIIDVDSLQQRYSTVNKIAQRDAEKVGAIAYKNDMEFKSENLKRYKDILQSAAVKLPLGKMVKDAIMDLTEQIKDGIKEFGRSVGKDDDVVIGTAPGGKEVTMIHAAMQMNRILGAFRSYTYAMGEQAELKDKYGDAPTHYDEDILIHAQKIKVEITKIKDFDYAWDRKYGHNKTFY